MARLSYGGWDYVWSSDWGGQWQTAHNGINRTAFVDRVILGPKGYMKGMGKDMKPGVSAAISSKVERAEK